MLTGAERTSLALTLGFLLLGAGLKLWTRARVELGPFAAEAAGPAGAFPVARPAASAPDTASDADTHADPEDGNVPAIGDDHASGAGEGDSPPAPPAPAPAALPPERGQESAGRSAAASPRGEARRMPKRKAPPAVKVDVNRASAAALTAVPGIGPKLADALVAYRREHGPFRDLGQLREVKGIGEKKWAALAPNLAVGTPQGGNAEPSGEGAGGPP